MNLTASTIVREGSRLFYEYRGKRGKTGKGELPKPADHAILTALAACDKDTSRQDTSRR
jgi:hypothetical protein